MFGCGAFVGLGGPDDDGASGRLVSAAAGRVSRDLSPMNDVLTPVLAQLSRRVDPDPADIACALAEILEGRVSDVQAAGFAVALRTKGETVDELSALVRTMLRYATPVDAVPANAIDTCGTGGDRSGSINVSTLATLVAVGAGATVVKHGNRAASSNCGSADVLEALGIPIELDAAAVARCVREAKVGFCFAPKFQPALRFLGPARRELGVPTTFNYLGPLLNPARVSRQVVGVSDPTMAERMLRVLHATGSTRAWVVHGDDGMDELTLTTTSTIYELVDDEVVRTAIDPADFGLESATADDLRGGDAATNAAVVRSVLDGAGGPARDISVLNAAAALVVAGCASDIADGVERARQAIDAGAARHALDSWVRVANEMAG
jgi:anthranilate phosphoribosyltransferase